MSAKTKIVVLKMKHILLLGIFIGIIALLTIFLITTFSNQNSPKPETVETGKYTPGVYTSCVSLGDESLDVSVCVDSNNINSISLVNKSETVETMYPLITPAMDDIVSQIIETQSTDNVSYQDNCQYTSIVLMDAINTSIEKAKTSQ